MELHILFGPTATSKTKMAQAMWEKTGYPILSVDSRKVYKGADIGTNKVGLLEFTSTHPEVLVGGIDFREPDEEISVYVYQQEVFRWVEEHHEAIQAAGGMILHGGTGLYLDAILEGNSLLSPRDAGLREELEKLDLSGLQSRAQCVAQKNYELMNPSDQQNPRRLVRLIENATMGEFSMEKDESWSSPPLSQVLAQSTRIWHIDIPPRAELWEVINARVHKYYEEGWLDEVDTLLKRYGPIAPALLMMGYRQLVAFMQANEDWRILVEHNDMKFQLVTQQIQLTHRQYAKRQETWAKKYQKLS